MNLNDKSFFLPLRDEMDDYWQWFDQLRLANLPEKIICQQGAGTEVERLPVHLAFCASAYVIAGRYLKKITQKRVVKVLEIGCGTGIGAYYLKTKLFPQIEVTAVDSSLDLIKYAQANYSLKGLKFVHLKTGNLPFKKERFDIILSFQVLEHIPAVEAELFFREIKRLLNPKGISLISTPNRQLCQELYFLNKNDEVRYRLIKGHEHEYTLADLKEKLSNWQKRKIIGRFQINFQVNLAYLKLWKIILGNFNSKKKQTCFLRNLAIFLRGLIPLQIQNQLTKLIWLLAQKKTGVTNKEIALLNQYLTKASNDKIISFFVVCQNE